MHSKRTDGRWGVAWFARMRKANESARVFWHDQSRSQQEMTDYITKFEEEIIDTIEGNKTRKKACLITCKVFKYPNVERVTYDRNEQIYKNQIVLTWVNSLFLT